MTTGRLYAISPSKLGTWLDCPRRFFLQYVERQRASGSWAHLSMGNAIHNALRDWFDDPAAPRTHERAEALVREHWQHGGFRDAEQSGQWQSAAAAMVWAYLSGLEPSFTPHSVERSLAALAPGISFNGRIDRLDAGVGDPESLVVVDYKTGKRIPSSDDARGSFALAIYAVCVERSLRRPCTQVELHHIPSGVVATHVYEPQTLDRQIGRVVQIAGEMTQAEEDQRAGASLDEVFPPRPGPLCGWCDVRDWCPEGAASAPKKDPWSGLPVADDEAPLPA